MVLFLAFLEVLCFSIILFLLICARSSSFIKLFLSELLLSFVFSVFIPDGVFLPKQLLLKLIIFMCILACGRLGLFVIAFLLFLLLLALLLVGLLFILALKLLLFVQVNSLS